MGGCHQFLILRSAAFRELEEVGKLSWSFKKVVGLDLGTALIAFSFFLPLLPPNLGFVWELESTKSVRVSPYWERLL